MHNGKFLNDWDTRQKCNNAAVESRVVLGEASVWRGMQMCVKKDKDSVGQLGPFQISVLQVFLINCVIGGKVERAVSSGTRQDICSSDAFLMK